MDQTQTIAACETIFARHLAGEPLLSNAAHLRGSAAWINFRRILCHTWSFNNLVLLGDAAHTAHFSIGSGTKLALEDAIKLAEVMNRPGLDLRVGLGEYQAERHVEVLKIQNSARNSTEWFETLDRYLDFDLPQFTYSLLTRSQRVSHENLRVRDRGWLEGLEAWFAAKVTAEAADTAPPWPMFTPFTLRGMTLANRVVVAPMLTYEADEEGRTTGFHLVHYGARAQGGAGLVMTEMLAVSPEGRATIACPGLYDPEQTRRWAEINAFIHDQSASKTCAQIGHAGPRASCRKPDRGYDVPLDQPWAVVAASAKPWKAGGLVPLALDEAGMATILEDFVAAIKNADAARFDMVEIQAGHGNLLSSFLTPMMNERIDAYGGSLENRLRFPMRVIEACRAAWPAHKPMSVRLSATDWVGDAGMTPMQTVEIARVLKEAGIDLIDVSAGETVPSAKPVYGRMFQTPFADQIRNEVSIPTMAVGNIYEPDQVNSILMAGRADLVAIGRPHLIDPMWTLHAAALAQQDVVSVPQAYRLGQSQLRRNLQRAAEIVQA
jgi:anthraniloyl-CoA monooxygenase